MIKISTLSVGLALALAPCLATPASAAGAAAYLRQNGSGTSCTLTTPCALMSNALTVAAGGEVICLDRGSYGGATITQSVIISCGEGLWEAAGNGVAIQGDADSKIQIEGLVVAALGGTSGTPGSAVVYSGAGTLSLLHVRVGAAVGQLSNGLFFTPSGAGKLQVTDSVFFNNGVFGGGAGILIKPQSGGTAQVELQHVTVTGNQFGVAVDGSESVNGINLTIADSVLASNVNDGVVATTSGGHAPVGIMVTNTKSTNNGFGIRSLGPSVTVRVNNSDIVGNGTGLSFDGGGALLTFGNNRLRANGVDGAFSGSVALQ